MSDVVVDTDVASFLFKRDTRARRYRRHLVGRTRYVSFMTVAELYRWGLARNWASERFVALERHLRRYNVVLADLGLCYRWAEVIQAAERRGQPLGVTDAWHAAVALSLHAPLVTNNPSDFNGVAGLVIITEAGP